MNLFEAKQILKKAGYRVINERETNLNYLIKDIFEVLTSFGISASDDEVKQLMWTYINSGRKPENSNAEDILEFDIDNAPDTIIHYTGDFVDWIKRGQYKTGPVDETKQMLKKHGYKLIREAAGNAYVVYEYSGSKPDWARVVTVTSDRDEIINAFYDFICYGPDDITNCGILKATPEETAKFRELAGKDLEHDPEGVKFLMDTVDKYNYPYEISGDYMYDLGFDLYDDNGDPTIDFNSPEFTKILKDYAEQSVDDAIANL